MFQGRPVKKDHPWISALAKVQDGGIFPYLSASIKVVLVSLLESWEENSTPVWFFIYVGPWNKEWWIIMDCIRYNKLSS